MNMAHKQLYNSLGTVCGKEKRTVSLDTSSLSHILLSGRSIWGDCSLRSDSGAVLPHNQKLGHPEHKS